MLIVSIYLFVIAADQYTSEAQFIVRTSEHPGVGNLASLMGGQKLSRATDESFAVADYLMSRDVVQELTRDDHLRDILSRPEADMFNRFPNMFSRNTDESLYRHYVNFVDIKISSESGIGTLRVRAFTPEDAQDLATGLLKHGEALVNRLNARAYDDALRFARQEVEASKTRLLGVETRLTDYRNSRAIIDPNKEAAAALASVGTLMTALTEVQVALSQQIATTPNSPVIGPMREKAQALKDQIAAQRAQIAGAQSSMAGSMEGYDKLMLDRELAERSLEAASVHLVSATQDAGEQQLYLQTIVAPNLSDMARDPKRLLIFMLALGLCLCVFVILRSLLKVLWEHKA